MKRALTRRKLLAGTAGAVGATFAQAALGTAGPVKQKAAGGKDGSRLRRAFDVRMRAAHIQCDGEPIRHRANGDEESVPDRLACYSKGLPHDHLGGVDQGAYELLLKALRSGATADFERVPIGNRVKLSNPQSALCFNLIGPDPSQTSLPPAPRFASAEQAAEMVELYWHALLRDVPFAEYESHPLVAEACEDLSRLSGYRGPKTGGRVTPRTIFRGPTAGDLQGPYLSQLLLKDVSFPPIRFPQRIRATAAGVDYMTTLSSWLACQNGEVAGPAKFEKEPRHVRDGRDLGEYVHRDFTYQAPLTAALIVIRMGSLPDAGNPYKSSRTQSGFTTFGPPYVLYLLSLVTQVALTACWFHKWMVHRRLRPEEFGGCVAQHLAGRRTSPLHSDLLDSKALARTAAAGTAGLLAMAYPEGCPTHPSYPAGHAAIAGACVTVLKAFFDESFPVPEAVEPTADGGLRPYQGPPLTLGGELDKLAANISLGRDFAGLHWRSDAVEGMRLGESVAVSVLRELRLTGNEVYEGFDFRTLDGKRLTI